MRSRQIVRGGAYSAAGAVARNVARSIVRQLAGHAVQRGVHAVGRYVGNRIRDRFKGNQKRRRAVVSIAAHGSASRSIAKYRYGRSRKGRKNSAQGTHTWTTTEAGRVDVGAGRQSNESKVAIWTKSQLSSIEGYYGNGTSLENQFMQIRPSVVKHMITNQSQSTVQFYIYDYVCRKSSNFLPYLLYYNDLRKQYDTSEDWANVVPNKPFQSPTLKYYWKLKKVTKIALEPGAVHEHIIVANTNAMLYENAWRNSPEYIAGLTMATLVQHHGFPVNDSTTVANVSLCPASYDYMSFYKLNVAFLDNRNKYLYHSGSLPSTTINPRTVMLEGGDVEVVDQA